MDTSIQKAVQTKRAAKTLTELWDGVNCLVVAPFPDHKRPEISVVKTLHVDKAGRLHQPDQGVGGHCIVAAAHHMGHTGCTAVIFYKIHRQVVVPILPIPYLKDQVPLAVVISHPVGFDLTPSRHRVGCRRKTVVEQHRSRRRSGDGGSRYHRL